MQQYTGCTMLPIIIYVICTVLQMRAEDAEHYLNFM